MYTFEQTKVGYANLWARATVLDDKKASAAAIAQKISDDTHRPRFEATQARTGVPWYFIGCLLYRESDLDIDTYLGNGQSLHHVTTQVPAGRGPFASFEDGAADALKYEGMTGIAASDWTAARMLYWAERFNGQGYFSKGNSPYIWSWTSEYHGGKFTSDHHYDPSVWDQQGGVAAILKALADINPDIAKALNTQEPVMADPQPTVNVPSTTVLPPQQPDPMQALLQLALQKVSQDIAGHPEIIMQILTGKATVTPPAAPATPVAPAPQTSTLGFGTGILGIVAYVAANAFGLVGSPMGEGATMAGQLWPTIAAAVAALGSNGSISGFLQSIVSKLVPSQPK